MRDDAPLAGRLTGRVLFGITLVTLGVAWTLDNAGLVDAGAILRWWPLALIAYGVIRLTGADGRKSVVSGALFTFFGLLLLFRATGILAACIPALWPAFLVAIGAWVIWRSRIAPGGSRADTESGAYPRPFAFMGGNKRTLDSPDLTGFEATAVMGGVEMDLRGARPRSGQVVGEVFAWWGGIDIIVPETWLVVCEATPIMGGVENKATRPAGPPEATLIVRGLLVMGGLDIVTRPRTG